MEKEKTSPRVLARESMRAAALLVALALALPLSIAHPQDGDCGNAADAGDHHAAATRVEPPVDCPGQLHSSWDSTDYYRFFCLPGMTAEATVTSDDLSVNLRAWFPDRGSDPVTRHPIRWDSTTGDGHARISFVCTLPGEYRLDLLYGGIEPGLFYVHYNLTLSTRFGG